MKQHHYNLNLEWTGNKGSGTENYRGYERSHTVRIEGKPEMLLSSDPVFRGDPGRFNPEELLVTSLSSCHMLAYLHVCVTLGVVVVDYKDQAEGIMEETAEGGGKFLSVKLRPKVTVTEESMVQKANEAHHRASELCFIAASVNFPVTHVPECLVQERAMGG